MIRKWYENDENKWGVVVLQWCVMFWCYLSCINRLIEITDLKEKKSSKCFSVQRQKECVECSTYSTVICQSHGTNISIWYTLTMYLIITVNFERKYHWVSTVPYTRYYIANMCSAACVLVLWVL